MKKRINLAAALLLCILTACSGARQDADKMSEAGQTEENGQENTGTESPANKKTAEVPCELDDGQLFLNSLFQSSIDNPDCQEKSGENIASIELQNQSGQFLAEADIEIHLSDGTVFHFVVEDLPAETTVMAFETANQELPENPQIEEILCKTDYESAMSLMSDQLMVQSDGTDVVISNTSDENLENLQIGFHCRFNEKMYYGGKTYVYSVESLPAGSEISLNVVECYMGSAEPVRICQKTK